MVSKKQTINKISKELYELLGNNEDTQHYRDEICELKEALHHLAHTINSQLQEGQEILKDFKEQGLSYGGIEAEGYVRACLTIKNFCKEWNGITQKMFD